MWSPHPTPRLSPTGFRARLTLEALDARLSPSSLIAYPDVPIPGSTETPVQVTSPPPAPEDDEELFLFGDGANAPPQIVNFAAVEIVGGLWRFTGDVVDEAPGGLTVTFGGEPVSLQNVTVTTDANGHFEKTVLLHTDGSDNGLASAQTVDGGGLASNVALYNINPG
jgi:hypothetical protein